MSDAWVFRESGREGYRPRTCALWISFHRGACASGRVRTSPAVQALRRRTAAPSVCPAERQECPQGVPDRVDSLFAYLPPFPLRVLPSLRRVPLRSGRARTPGKSPRGLPPELPPQILEESRALRRNVTRNQATPNRSGSSFSHPPQIEGIHSRRETGHCCPTEGACHLGSFPVRAS